MAKKETSFETTLWQPSEQLAKVIGSKPLPRTQVTKKIWAYIKKNDLQHPENKRTIVPDAILAGVLGKKDIDMFKMTAVVSKHLKKLK